MTKQQIQSILLKMFKAPALVNEIIKNGTLLIVPRGKEIVGYKDIVTVLPIILKGAVNIYVNQNDDEILAYTLQQESLCVTSYEISLQKKPSVFKAISDVNDSYLLLVPTTIIQNILEEHPNFALSLFSEYAKCQQNLIESLKSLAFTNLEYRLKTYLENDNNRMKTHQEIANDLGTAREVVTRLVKKIYAS